MLYRHADLTGVEGGQPGPWVPLYVRTMRTYPHLRALVRILHIATRGTPFPELHGWIPLLPKDSLAFLDYSWDDNKWDKFGDSFRLSVFQAPAVRAIRKLHTCGSYSPTVLASIMTLSRLEELVITVERMQDLTFHVPTPTPRLKHLDITINPTFSAPSFDLLHILVTAPQLETLTIHMQTLDLFAYKGLSRALRSTTPRSGDLACTATWRNGPSSTARSWTVSSYNHHHSRSSAAIRAHSRITSSDTFPRQSRYLIS